MFLLLLFSPTFHLSRPNYFFDGERKNPPNFNPCFLLDDQFIKVDSIFIPPHKPKEHIPGFGDLHSSLNRILKGGVVIPLIFPKIPQSLLAILRVPQLFPPLGHPLLKNPIISLHRRNQRFWTDR